MKMQLFLFCLLCYYFFFFVIFLVSICTLLFTCTWRALSWRHCQSCQQQNLCWELRSRAAHPSAELDSAAISLYPSWGKIQRGGGLSIKDTITKPTCGSHDVSSTHRGWTWTHHRLRSASSKLSPYPTPAQTNRLSVCCFVFACVCVSHGGRSARRLQRRLDSACENWSGRWESICAGCGQPRAACALRRYRMQRRRRRSGSDCRGAGWQHNYSCTAVWVHTLAGFKGHQMKNLICLAVNFHLN